MANESTAESNKTDHVRLTEYIPRPISEQKAWFAFKYTKLGDIWIGERLAISCLDSLLSIINRWEEDVNARGFFVGEVAKGNKYPEIPLYEEAFALYKAQTDSLLSEFRKRNQPAVKPKRNKGK